MKRKFKMFSYDSSINEILELAYAFEKSRILLTACELDIFTIIGDDEMGATAIATAAGCDQNATERLLNALTAINLLEKHEEKYSNTEVSGEILVRGKENYMSNLRHFLFLWQRWGKLTESVRTGSAVDFVDVGSRSGDQIVDYIAAMNWRAGKQARDLIKMIDLGDVHSVLDLGGGSGAFAIEFMKLKPSLEVTLFDLPDVISISEKYIEDAGFGGRIRTIKGDFRKDDLGGPYDLVFLSQIIHLNSLWENIELSKKIYFALADNGQMVIHDFLIDDDKVNPAFSALFSLNMLVNTRAGDVYRFTDLQIMLKEAWFDNIEQLKTPLNTDLVLARKI